MPALIPLATTCGPPTIDNPSLFNVVLPTFKLPVDASSILLAKPTRIVPSASTFVKIFLPKSDSSNSVFVSSPLTAIVSPNSIGAFVPLFAATTKPLLITSRTALFKSPAFTAWFAFRTSV